MSEIIIWYIGKNQLNKSEKFYRNTTDFKLFRKGISSIDLSQFTQYPKIKTLDLARNGIDTIDLTPLSQCQNLQTLYLSFNKIHEIDLSPLHRCSNLRGLSLRKNKLKYVDISSLFFCLNLHELKFDKGITLIADSRLRTTEYKPVGIIQFLDAIQWREDLLSEGMIQGLDELGKAQQPLPIDTVALAYVTKSGTKMMEWVSTKSTEVSLFRKGIHEIDLSPLRLCPNLKVLDLARNRIQDIDLSPLSECHNLETLYISFNHLKSIDLTPLHNCSKLKRLSFRKNPLTSIDISPLFTCLSLEELKIEDIVTVVAESGLKNIPQKPQVLANLFGRISWTDGLHSSEFIERLMKFTPSIVPPESPSKKALPTKKHPQSVKPPKRAPSEGKVKILRGCEIVGGKFDYKVKVQNDSPYVITNVTVTIVAYPKDCMNLSGENMKVIARIEPAGFRSPQFSFLPTKDCVEGQVLATVSYVDYQNSLQVGSVEPYIIRSVCDLLKPLKSTANEFDTILSNLSSTSEEHTLDWNAQVLFAKAQILLPIKNFHVIDSSDRTIGGHFTGTIRGFAEGKYSGKRIALQILITGSMDGNQSSVVIEGLGDDTAMLPTTIDEIAHGIESWMCINCGAAFSSEEVTTLLTSQPITCQYCKRTLTIGLYRR